MAENRSAKAPALFIRTLKKAMDQHPDKPSLRQVAMRADLSPAFLSFLLNGERGLPSNDAIARLERVLCIPSGELFKAAGRPDDKALAFFRKDDAAAIVRTLAPLPNSKLADIRRND